MITLFISKDFFWVDSANNIFVFPGQVFMVKDPANLPRPVNAEGWEHYYTKIEIAKYESPSLFGEFRR